MKVRKIVAALAAVSMVAVMSAQAVMAADTVTITAGNAEVSKAGETFTLDVKLSGVPAAGVSVCEFALKYDASLVTITGVEAGAIAKNGADDVEKFEGASAFETDFSTSGVIEVTYTTGLTDSAYWITKDGVFMTITGKVSDSAKAGDSTKVEIVAIDRETLEGSGTKNTEIVMGNLDATGAANKFGTSVKAGSVTVKDADKPTETVKPTQGDEPGDVLYGDATVDGEVNVADVIKVAKYTLGADKLTAQGSKNADVDLSGTVTSDDANFIIKSLVQIVTLPIK